MKRIAAACACLAVTALGSVLAAADRADEQRMRRTINGLRGVTLEGLGDKEIDRLGQRFEDAWNVLLENPGLSLPIVREVLREQDVRRDDFLAIDLSGFLLFTDRSDGVPEEVAGVLERVDPNANPSSFFHSVSYLAAQHCEPCRPAVLKMLELESLESYIAAHALRIDIDLGMLFTISQYGDAMIDAVAGHLADTDCTVRGNAARALGNLLPLRKLETFRTMAMDDECGAARGGAWMGLVLLRDPQAAALALRRLDDREAMRPEERGYLPLALYLGLEPRYRERLETLTRDDDAVIAGAAKKVLRLPAATKPVLGGAGARARKKARSELERIAKKGRARRRIDSAELLAALTLEDLPLLNAARAAVLQRLSDECLREYYALTYAAAWLRLEWLRTPGGE